MVPSIYIIHHWNIEGFLEVAIESWSKWDLKPRPLNHALTNWAIKPWVQLALRANFVELLQFHFFVQCSRFISVFAFVSRHICFKRSLVQVITWVAEWFNPYGIRRWRIFRSSYRNLARVGFEPITTETESRLDTLTDEAIRSWVELVLRANFVQLLQSHLFVQCSRFISVFAFVSRHICFKRSIVQ